MDSVFHKDEKLKCGDICIRSNGILSLVCGFCKVDEFFTLDAYKDHFNCHFPARKLSDNIQVEPPISQPDVSVSTYCHHISDVEDDMAPDDPLETTESTSVALAVEIIQDEKIIVDLLDDNSSNNGMQHFVICDYCQTEVSKDELSQHMLNVHSIGFQCSQCDENYPTAYARDEHAVKVHKQPNFSCERCNIQFPRKRFLTDHNWKVHSIGMPLSTDLLRNQINSQDYSTMSSKKRNPLWSQPCSCNRPQCQKHKFTCDLCNAGLTTKAYLEQHRWRDHLVGAACRHCARQFSTGRIRDEHEKTHTGEPQTKDQAAAAHSDHNGRQKPPNKMYGSKYKCEHCDESFALRKTLRVHTWTAHNIGEKCRYCGKQFREPVNRKIHERIHTGKHPYKCKYCPHTFSTKTPLKHHTMLHEDDLPFLCPTCGKRYVSITKLNNHTRDKHTDLLANNFPCTVCGRSFAHQHRLRDHYKKNHQVGELTTFTCDICQRKLINRKCLVQHMRIHTGTKPYKCRYCEMSFAQAAGKRGHERNRHENLVV